MIDIWPWGRAALSFAEMSFAEFDFLVRHLGQGLAGEVLLLSISKKCGTDMRKWESARKLGIPWLFKRWSSFLAMERCYTMLQTSATQLVQHSSGDTDAQGSVADATLSGARNVLLQ